MKRNLAFIMLKQSQNIHLLNLISEDKAIFFKTILKNWYNSLGKGLSHSIYNNILFFKHIINNIVNENSIG